MHWFWYDIPTTDSLSTYSQWSNRHRTPCSVFWRRAGVAFSGRSSPRSEVSELWGRFKVSGLIAMIKDADGKRSVSSFFALPSYMQRRMKRGWRSFFFSEDGQPVTHPSRRQVFRIAQKPDISLTSAFSPHWSPRGPYRLNICPD